MKEKIILVIYLILRIYISTIYKIINEYIYYVTYSCLILTLNTSFLDIKPILIHTGKLAFHTNILHVPTFINVKKQIIKIKIEGLNKILKQKILSYNYILSKQKLIYNIYIIKLIDNLKNCGFFNRIEHSIVNIYNIKYFIIHLKINPIITKIRILKYNQLKIPQHLLINILKNQIGLPRNYKHIKKSIEKIYSWYNNQGFEWIHIELLEDTIPNNIYFKILEGQIIKSYLICQQQNTISPVLMNNIESTIQNRLEIIPGYILNIKELEKGIIYLKKIKLISSCKYKIIKCENGIQIKFQYSIPINQQGYFYNKNLIINLNRLYNRYYEQYKIRKTFILNNVNERIKKHIKHVIGLNTIIKFILSKIDNQIANTILYQSFGFKYNRSQQGVYYKNCITDFQFLNQIPTLNIIFSCPNIYINKYLYGSMIFNLYKKFYKVSTLYPIKTIRLSNSLTNKTYYLNLKSLGVQIQYNRIHYNNIHLSEHILKEYKLYKKLFFNIQNYSNTKNKIFNNQIKIQDLYKSIQQKLLCLKIQLKYGNSELYSYIKSSKSFIIESTSFTSIKLNINNYLYINRSPGQNIKIKYNHTFVFPQIIPYIKNHALIILTEINWLFGHKMYIPIFYNNYQYDVNMYYQYESTQYNNFFIKYLCNIEYHIQIYNYVSLYVLYNLSNQLYNQSTNNTIILNILYNIYPIYYYVIKTGIGIQLNIPIRKIPPIRFEYKVHNNIKNLSYLRIYSLYNN